MTCLTSPPPRSSGGSVRMEEVWGTEPGSPRATMLPGRLGLQRWWVGGGLKKKSNYWSFVAVDVIPAPLF